MRKAHRRYRDLFAKPGLRSRTLPRAVAAFLLLSYMPLSAQTPLATEYRSKANCLANFPSFVEWPAETLPPTNAPFLVCVFGEFSFGTSLAELTRGAAVHNRRLEIRWMHNLQELTACQVVFVSRSEQKRYSQALDVLRGKTVLTVGETPEFLDAGGILTFSGNQGTIQFDVNLAAASKARLKVSSRLLVLARRVVNQTEAAR